jgi:hypothetical protein
MFLTDLRGNPETEIYIRASAGEKRVRATSRAAKVGRRGAADRSCIPLFSNARSRRGVSERDGERQEQSRGDD